MPLNMNSLQLSPRCQGPHPAFPRPLSTQCAPILLTQSSAAEAAFIGTLRNHYVRNGTVESFAPRFKAAPHRAYARTDGGATASASPAASSGEARLQAQEQALWAEREEELLDAQVGAALGRRPWHAQRWALPVGPGPAGLAPA